jgi:hypothetical protein
VRETPQEAHGEAVAILERIKGGTAPSAAMTLAKALDAILGDCERRERRDATADCYRYHLGAWITHFGEGKRLASFTVEDLQGSLTSGAKTTSAGSPSSTRGRCDSPASSRTQRGRQSSSGPR